MNNFLLIFLKITPHFALPFCLTLCVWVFSISSLSPFFVHFLSFTHLFDNLNAQQEIMTIVCIVNRHVHMKNHLILASNECLIYNMFIFLFSETIHGSIRFAHSHSLVSTLQALCFEARSSNSYELRKWKSENNTKTKKTQRPSDAQIEHGVSDNFCFVIWVAT